jgi:aminoglycoside 2'-N-acetyltransferase I
MRIVSFAEADVPADLRVHVLALQREAWPGLEDNERWPTHDPALRPQLMLLLQAETVLSSLAILSKDIAHAGHRFAASGLSTVVTRGAERGKGYGLHLVVSAREVIEASGVDLGIFTCDRPLQAFYERGGWQLLPGTVLVGGTPDSPFPSDQFDKVTMARFFSPMARDHADAFGGSRIELYPGEIDKLW